MPRFYFHLYNDAVAMDEEGRVLPDLDSARAAAVKEAREMMTESVLEGHLTRVEHGVLRQAGAQNSQSLEAWMRPAW